MKSIKKYGFFVVIVLVGLIDLCYGVITWYQKENFIKNARETTGHIYSISYQENSSVLSLYYHVKEKRYDQILVLDDKNIPIYDSIKIYYDPKDPTKISSDEVSHIEIVIIVLGFLFSLLGGFLIFKTSRKT